MRLRAEHDDPDAEGGPRRKCVATGEVRPCGDLVRFVLDPQGVITPDLASRLPGRGAWVLATRGAIEKAAGARGGFARAFRAGATLPEGVSPDALADDIERGLAARALSALGLLRRAGAVATGFDQVRAALKDGKAGILVCASDASSDGVGKLTRLALNKPTVRAFTTEEQSRALGRDGVVHAAVASGAGAAGFLREVGRLAGFRPVFQAKADEYEPESIVPESIV